MALSFDWFSGSSAYFFGSQKIETAKFEIPQSELDCSKLIVLSVDSLETRMWVCLSFRSCYSVFLKWKKPKHILGGLIARL